MKCKRGFDTGYRCQADAQFASPYCEAHGPRVSLVRVLANLTEEEARAVYEAISQWSDNERNGLEEDCPRTESERLEHDAREWEVSLVEGVVGKLDTEFVKLAEAG